MQRNGARLKQISAQNIEKKDVDGGWFFSKAIKAYNNFIVAYRFFSSF